MCTTLTPGTARMPGKCARGSDSDMPWSPWTIRISALVSAISRSMPLFIPCSRPKSRKAIRICSRIKVARPRLRHMPDHMRGKYFTGPSAEKRFLLTLDVHAHAEQVAGHGLLGKLFLRERQPCRCHAQLVAIPPAKRACGGVRHPKSYFPFLLAVRIVSNDFPSAPKRDQDVTLGVHRKAVRKAVGLDGLRENPAIADRARGRRIAVRVNDSAMGVDEIKSALIGRPTQPVRNGKPAIHDVHGAVGVESVQRSMGFFRFLGIHASDPEPAVRIHTALIETHGRPIVDSCNRAQP